MRARIPTLPCLLLAALAAGLVPGPALAAKAAALSADCQMLLELYRDCHRLGAQSDSAQTCEEGAQDFNVRHDPRSAKNPQAARALMELVCTTGCEDAAASRPPATPQEFSEAFCNTAPQTKPQGGRP
jgi:hypothetical protein